MRMIARHAGRFARPNDLTTRTALWLQAVGATTALAAIWLDAQGLGWAASSIVLYLVVATCVLARIADSHPFDVFGAANIVTLVRAGLVSLVASTIFMPQPGGEAALIAVAIAALALALDGADGWLARRNGLSSRFGARFDLEIDALFILVLSTAAYMHGKAGVWVLAIGLMRYGFFTAGVLSSRLEAPLPPSTRRKAVCVIQIAALSLLFLPQIEQPLSQWIAAGALVALSYSFAADIIWLMRTDRKR